MKLKYLLAASVVSLSAAATIATPAAAQQITSGVEGQVTAADGGALAGALVTVTDTRTGAVRTSTTDSAGNFRVQSLQPGGPYTVTVTAAGYEGQTVEDVQLNISGNQSFNFALTSGAAETIVVTGARARATQVAVGPGSAFDQQTLEAFPSITRDIRDIIRIDPRVSIEQSNDVDRISCLGGNDRTNTFTVDGIVQSDTFGLNGTPFAARNSLPLPFDVIAQTSVEFAPFDVEYSDFTGCLVNVVTKSGSNRFSGSAFITYFDSGLFADNIDGINLNANEEKRWGATLSGPIIKDRLFFSFGYEEADLTQGNNFGPAGGGFPNESNGVSQAQFEEFAQIARDVYGQDVGGYPTSLPEGNVRYFGRIDAQITDDHRLEATYQRLEETNVESDFGGSITGLNSFEDEGTISDYYAVRLYSQWSDSLSTELRVSRSEVGDVQGPVGFGEAQSANPTVRLRVGVLPDGTPTSDGGVTDQFGSLSTGPGIFRSANQLDQKIDQARFQMNYDAGAGHFLKFGAEINDLEVFNLFAINATGTLYFQNLADFREGLLSPGTELFPNNEEIALGEALGGDINAAQGGDINNAAALFSRRIYSVYAQDEWQATDQLSINAGIRVQMYDGDAPQANPNFLDRYGFTNRNSFGRIDTVLLPRLSATYEFDNDGFFSNSSLTGGVGIFSGGDPVVYFSNAFSNNGFSTALGTTRFDCGAGDLPVDPATGQLDVVTGGTFNGFPQCAIDGAVADAEAGNADVQSTDPDFDVPTVVRANMSFRTTFGTETGFFSNWNLNLDYIYSRFNDTINFVDLSQAPDIRTNGGFTVDGRPILQAVDATNAGCNASLVGNGGTPPVYTGLTPECFNTGRDDNIQLTNGRSSESHAFSVLVSKNFDGGLFTSGGSTRLNLGYTFVDSENARNNQSSTATSSFDVTAAFDRQDPAVSTATTEVRHNFVATLNLREEFIDGYDTNLGIFFRAREGRPYSLTFKGGGVFADRSSGNGNALLYVPTGANDPNVSPDSDPGLAQAVLDYVEGTNCEFTPGETIRRNTCRNDWHVDMDLRISQEIPFIGSLTGIANDRIEVFADFANFLNLIDSGANILRQRGGFNGLVDIVDVDVDDQGRYVYEFDTGQSVLTPNDQNFIAINPSAWRIQIGARYEF